MRRLRITSMFVWIVLLVGAAPATASMEIRRVQFDPFGEDTGSNRHLNREYIYLVNTGNNAKQLRGWKVFDRDRDHVYRFTSVLLDPGDTIRLRTGRGSFDGAPACEKGKPCPENAHYNFYWGLEEYVWDNDGDVATLRNDEGAVVDRCRYTAAVSSPKRC